MAFKYLILAMLALILISLGKALFHLSSTARTTGKKWSWRWPGVSACRWRCSCC